MTGDGTSRVLFRASNKVDQPVLAQFFALTGGISWLI